MTYKTVNLKPSTYERLRQYQVGGLSMDAVINSLMDRVDVSKFYEDKLKMFQRRLREARSGKARPAEELRKEFGDE